MSGVVRSIAIAAVAVLLAATTASAGPIEAREAWKYAQSIRTAPWRLRLAALRAARRLVGETDRLYPRILAAEASVLRDAGLVFAADALDSQAADIGPERDESRLGRMLSAARDFDREGDEWAALERLGEVIERGRAEEFVFGPALVLRARIAADRDDDATLAALVRAAASLSAVRVGDRMAVIDYAGVVRLRAGDRRAARSALEDAKRLYADATRRGDDIAKFAARAWLRLSLPKLLDEVK